MAVAATKAELQRVLDRVAFTRAYGFRLHSISSGRCTLDVPFQTRFERPGGIVSGQVFMAAADVAMWLAIMTQLGARDGSVTAGMTSAFLGAARHEPFRCTARIVKLGRRLVYGVAESVSRSGRLLTHHSLTYARAPR
jgi:acyl-coenzyme A thioesterase PaaI-like protein